MRLGPAEGALPFTLEGRPYTLAIPADGLTACAWPATGNWFALVPGALHEDSADRFLALLTDPYGPVGLRVCQRLAYGLSRAVYGFEWHVAGRLTATAEQHWDLFSAWTVTVGFDPGAAAPHRVCSAVLAWMRATCQEEKDWRRMESQLYAPPRDQLRRGRTRAVVPGFGRDEQAASWEQAFAQLGAGG